MFDGFFKYVKRAFLFKWNLLAFGAAAVAGIISGSPEVVLPLAMAFELIYLAGLATHPRFQAAIDAEDHKAQKEGDGARAQAKIEHILDSLAIDDRAQFEQLKNQCVDLRHIAASVKGDPDRPGSGIDGLQSEGMNRLLWIYLKLLFSKNAVERFFETIDEDQIHADIKQAELRLAGLGPTEDDSPNDSRRRVSLEDQLKTCEARLENYRKAEDNYEFVQDELKRLALKISSLAEMAVNRQDPNFITSEVDNVSASVVNSEKAMSELDFITGFAASDDITPELLDVEE